MNIKSIEVSLINICNNEVYQGRIGLSGNYPSCCLLLILYGHQNIEVKGYDYFKCLINLRIQLEKQNLNILCNGATKDVCCEGMLRRYSNGLQGHIIKLGQYISEDNKLSIFGYSEPNTVVSINEQKKFYKLYCSSLPDYPDEE
jgi:hypothetical protein